MSMTNEELLGDFEDAAREHEAAGSKEAAAARRQLETTRAAVLARMTPDWQPIDEEASMPPHNEPVLLGWRDWHSNKWVMEVACYSTGHRSTVSSSISRHGQATHWLPLPASPAEPCP